MSEYTSQTPEPVPSDTLASAQRTPTPAGQPTPAQPESGVSHLHQEIAAHPIEHHAVSATSSSPQGVASPASHSPVPPTSYPSPSHPSTPVSTPVTPGQRFTESVAPEPARAHAATNPLMALLVGALLSAALLGTGIVIGRGSAHGSVPGMGTYGTSGVNASSGNAIVQAAKLVGPSVMNVDTTFGKTDTDYLPAPGTENQPHAGKGTGFIIDTKRGLMLTNAHVVAGAEKIQVTTNSGQKYTGKVLGFDRQSDIAVVELSNKTLPQVKLADFKDPKELPIGDWTIAIGNPFGQENTVTVGVLSAIGRKLPVPANEGESGFELTDMLQTDTAINPGNSGGPLCNLKGEVIGINTAIIPYGQGLGFTIPINKAKAVADEIVKHGKILHPYIGVVVKQITDNLKGDLGLPDKKGGLVSGIEPDSPAAKSGLQEGDVIRKLDGKTMNTNEDVVKEIGKRKVGDKIKVEVLRNNSVSKTLELKVGDRPQK